MSAFQPLALQSNQPFAVFQKTGTYGAGAATVRDPMINFIRMNNATAAVTLSTEAMVNGRPIAVHSTLDGAQVLPPSGWTVVLYNGGTLDANNNGITGGAGTNGFHCFLVPDFTNQELVVFAPDNVIGVA